MSEKIQDNKPKNPKIKFSHHWKKLDCSSGSLFTTIRSENGRFPSKAEYYKNQEGKTFDVMLNEEKLFQAELVQVFRGKSKDLSGRLLFYDTDGNVEWMEKLENLGQVLVLLFKRE